MFHLDVSADTIGITEVGEVEVVPAALNSSALRDQAMISRSAASMFFLARVARSSCFTTGRQRIYGRTT